MSTLQKLLHPGLKWPRKCKLLTRQSYHWTKLYKNKLNLNFATSMHCRLIKNNRPISDFTWLNELDIAKDCDHGISYNNPTAATAFFRVYFWCRKGKDEWMADRYLHGIKFFSLTIDGSIDSAVVEQEALYKYIFLFIWIWKNCYTICLHWWAKFNLFSKLVNFCERQYKRKWVWGRHE